MGILLLMCWSSFVSLLLNFFPFHANSFNTSNLQLSCHEDEKSALLQFKHSFIIDKSTCRYDGDYPKASYWDSEGGSSNCCTWDGVECDEETAHVIGLDLSGGCISGSIYSNSTLFHLVRLRKLNLAANHFNRSSIPTSIGQLSELTYLNLSSSFFFGQIPHEISQLSKLTTLDLSWRYDELAENLLKLNRPTLRSLIQNSTHLEILRLDYVDLLSNIPDFLANFSSLTDLGLGNAGLYGPIPSSLSKLTQLVRLRLAYNHLSGYIPSSLQNLTHLIDLRLQGNQISGSMPSWLGNLTELKVIYLLGNKLHGSIPQSLFKLNNLETLYLDGNYLGGTLQFDMFSKMRRLAQLGLADNKLSLLFGERNSINGTTLPQFKLLGLSSCNISDKFPEFLRHQNELRFLDLSENSIRGQIPKWIWNSSVQTLIWFNLSNNFLTGFQNPPTVLPWAQLQVVDINSNMLHGQLMIPRSSSMEHVDVSKNKLSGEISPLICNLISIRVLDLSHNNFNGTLPHCLGSLSSSLLALNLRNNSFHGIIPLAIERASNLLMIDFSHNQFQGKLPRSLAICTMLEYLDFSNNQLIDVFPTWLGTLPRLKVLFLQKNGFYGAIQRAKNTSEFPNLHIIDISYNSFRGALPYEYIFIWNGRKTFEMSNSTYMNAGVSIQVGPREKYLIYYHYATTLVIKSVETYYGKIREELAVINLSSNKFIGEIPEFVGNLMALHSLNLSNNMLTGRIPLSIKGLSKLESLDLSRNMLSGEIPQQLTQLNFLQSFNVSHNNLTGPIPQGDQLCTFDQSSFEGNPGLCGCPLSKKCGDSEALQPAPSADEKDDDSGSPIELDWKFVLAGAISGFVVGVVLGDMAITKRWGWFLRAFRRTPPRIEIRPLRN